MQFKSIKCPNCGGPAREMGDGKFVCESCGTSFMADYDKEDVEYQKAKAFAEREKMKTERQKAGIEMVQGIQRSSLRAPKIIALVVSVTFVVVIMTINIVVFSFVRRAVQGSSYEDRRKSEEAQASMVRESMEEELRIRESEAIRALEESKALELASYQVTPDDLLADAFFVENAMGALRSGLENNTKLYWTNWVWNEEPEYVTSYLLIAKNKESFDHNYVVNIYKIHWDKEYEKRTDKYVMYDACCLRNVSLNEDGTIKSDYNPEQLTYHNEIVANQFLNGYSDYDQLIRQEIYGNSDYHFEEFQFPGAADGAVTEESESPAE